MKAFVVIALISMIPVICQGGEPLKSVGYPINPIPFTAVRITDQFWGNRLEASRKVTIPLAFSKCQETGRYTNFVNAAHPDTNYVVGGFPFDDTDVYKTIEGASYLLQTYSDPVLSHYIDSVLTIVAAAQEKDGYLYTARTMNPKNPHKWSGPKRWSKEEDGSHELYNLGHMLESAVAHFQATGKRNFLDIAIRYADCVCREVGKSPGQACVVPGHQIAEMGLVKLYLATGDRKYLDEAKFLLDFRGHTTKKQSYSQSDKPVIDQDEAVGHAVRAVYMYSGMADVAALTGDSAYIKALSKIWKNVVEKKYYITGGIGATSNGEAFGKNYELPNMSAYCETCAAIGNVYWNQRLFLLHGQSKYIDVLERSLYNGVLSGVSLDGGSFFYPNPLESAGQHQRQPWFGCACCPSNICRFIPSVPGYLYAAKGNTLYLNLFASNKAKVQVGGKMIDIEEKTNYPWDGNIKFKIESNPNRAFDLKIRIPGWLLNHPVPGDLYTYADSVQPEYRINVNGKMVSSTLQNGYFGISRIWKKGDLVEINFDMKPRVVRAHSLVSADKGKVAVERGPLVYCAEWPDNAFNITNILLNREPKFKVENHPELLSSINTITTNVQVLGFNADGLLQTKDEKLTLIPYYSWAHRGAGNMTVWLPYDLAASRPAKPSTLANESKLEASVPSSSLFAVRDGLCPDEGSESIPYYHWWPRKNTTEWVIYHFPKANRVSSSKVYWFDDGPWGGCRIPKNWRILFKDLQNNWKLVKPLSTYHNEKGVNNQINFEPVLTTELKLEVDLQADYSSGIYEWEVN